MSDAYTAMSVLAKKSVWSYPSEWSSSGQLCSGLQRFPDTIEVWANSRPGSSCNVECARVFPFTV